MGVNARLRCEIAESHFYKLKLLPHSLFAVFGKIALGLGLMSGAINILALTGVFFMLQVYDRVIPSRSLSTLMGLVIVAATLYAFLGVLDILRSRLMVRANRLVDVRLSPTVFSSIHFVEHRTGANDGLQYLRDLDHLRSFLASPGRPHFWMPHGFLSMSGFAFYSTSGSELRFFVVQSSF